MNGDTLELRLAVLDEEARAQVMRFAGFVRDAVGQGAGQAEAKAAEAWAQTARRSAERTADEITSLLVDGLVRVGRAGDDMFDDMWRRALAGAQQLAASIAATLLRETIVLPIVAQVKGLPAAGGPAPGGAAPAGGLLGTVGGAMPYIGTGLAVATLLAGSLFRRKPSVGPGQAVTLQQGADALEVLRVAEDNGGSLALAERYARSVPGSFDDLFGVLGGGRFAAGVGVNIGNNQKEGFQYSLYAPGQAAGGRDSIAEAKNLESVEEAVVQSFLRAIEHGLVEGLSASFDTAFAAVRPQTTDELADIVARVQAYEQAIAPIATALTPATSALGQAIAANAASFDALRDSARELHLALEPLNAAEAERLATLRQGFVDGLESQARESGGQGFINALLGAVGQAEAQAASNLAGFAEDGAALARNQDLINTIFAGTVDQALAGLDTAQLGEVVAFFGDQATTTGAYIAAVADHLIALGAAAGTAEDSVGGLTRRGAEMLSDLETRALRLEGRDREALEAELALGKARELAAALAEGFDPAQYARLETVIDGEVRAALEAFDQALIDTAEAARLATDRLEAEREAALRASRDFDTDLGIRELSLAGDDRGALAARLAAQADASIAAAEAAGRTAEQIERLRLVLQGETTAALAAFDARLGEIAGSAGAATDALRRFDEDLRVRAADLAGDDLASALLRFDLAAQREREAAAAIAGADLAELERILAAERLQILEEWNARLAEAQARAAETAMREAERAVEAERRAQEEAARAAEEAARRIADAMREAAAAMDDYRVRDLRAQGLEHEAQILAKQLANAEELRRVDALIQAGATNLDRRLVERVLARELQNVIDGTAVAGGRGAGYDPQSYDRFFTVSASAALVNARESLRDADLLRSLAAIDRGTSNVIPFPLAGGSPVDGTARAPHGFDSLRPFSAASFAEVEALFGGLFGSLREPLAGLRDDTTAMVTLLRDILVAVKGAGTGTVDIDVFTLPRPRRHTRPAAAPPPVLDWTSARMGRS